MVVSDTMNTEQNKFYNDFDTEIDTEIRQTEIIWTEKTTEGSWMLEEFSHQREEIEEPDYLIYEPTEQDLQALDNLYLDYYESVFDICSQCNQPGIKIFGD